MTLDEIITKLLKAEIKLYHDKFHKYQKVKLKNEFIQDYGDKSGIVVNIMYRGLEYGELNLDTFEFNKIYQVLCLGEYGERFINNYGEHMLESIE